MSVSDETYYNIKWMHVVFAAAALLLLAATVWMLAADNRRSWKAYQQQYHALTGRGHRSPEIEQTWLPELTINYHFRQVARADRCTTCHQGVDKPSALSPPYAPHPRLDLFLGAASPHPQAEFGCTICHDGQGSATDFQWASHAPNDAQQRQRWQHELGWSANPHWDFPMLARRFHQSRCLACHQNVTDLEPSRRFPDAPAAKLTAGYQLVRQYGCFGCHEIPVFRDVGHKVGPSLRNIAGKVRPKYLADHIRNPSESLPSTRMPRQYGLWEHLEGRVLADTQRSEEAEIGAIVDELLGSAANLQPPPVLSGVTEPPSAERGKRLFETQGCLACHRHRDFPHGEATQGPDLSRVGAKYLPGSGERWLTGWLRDPARYGSKTLMPNPLLATVPLDDGPKTTDPAADLAAYLAGGEGREARDEGKNKESSAHRSSSPVPRPSSAAPASPGRRVIAKRGCFGCHDIPGFEAAAPIGPTLSDWGRKPESLLAFEEINEFIQKKPASRLAVPGTSANVPAGTLATNSDDGFFRDALLEHHREGFLWQKLRMPRSFDYQVANHKPCDEQLKMGRFDLSDAQREAVMTYILALTDETPAAKYVYQPDRQHKAIAEGRKILDKYACAECHTLGLERWTIGRKSEISGVPRLNISGAVAQDEDDDGKPICFFTLWEPATIDGRRCPVGGADVVVPKAQLTSVRPPWGGTLARLLYPVVLDQARSSGASAAEVEAWGWVPPALVHEGAIVRPEWLFRYLLDPTVIRPAAVLRMPRFSLSTVEAQKLADYFAAVSGAEYPYTAPPAGSSGPLNTAGLDRAMKLLLDRNTYCAKCHLIGDYRPVGKNRTLLAPKLDGTAGRLRPEYVRRWLADPKSVLPYTAMPAHFPMTGKPLGQDLFPGSSREQLDAVTELLLRYDEYARHRAKMAN
jgi:cytochrome c551/c552